MGECAAEAAGGAQKDVPLTSDEQRCLLRLARSTVEAHVRGMPIPNVDDEAMTHPLREKRAVFVTLRQEGRLRGCVGYPTHRIGLARAVQENAVNAACRDHRFYPIVVEEVASIAIEISVLSRGDTPNRPFIRLADPFAIVIGRDGLYLEHAGGFTGIFLPQVPVEQRWNVNEYLEGICQKAGLPSDTWRDPQTTLYRFTAEVFSEKTPVSA